MNILYKIKFHSTWHSGSGEARGADIDSTVIRDFQGFPYFPGKTMKGIIKDAMIDSLGLDEPNEIISKLFGKEARKEDEPDAIEAGKEEEYGNGTIGICHFTDASVSPGLKTEIEKKESLKESMYLKVASTAVKDDGTAKEHSLRTMEVVVPLTLYAQILNIPEKYVSYMENALKMVKRMGAGRNRGFGRCTLEPMEGGVL